MIHQRRKTPTGGLLWGFMYPDGQIVWGTQGFVENLEATMEGVIVRGNGEEWYVWR